MYVDVDSGRVHLEEDEVGHLFALGNEVVEGFHHSIVEARMAHEATVDEEILRSSLLACRIGLAHEAAYLHQRRLYLHRQELFAELLAEDVHDALQGTACRKLHQVVAVA